MATVAVTHQKVSSGTVNAAVEVDLHDWNNTHTVTGLENVPNVDTSTATNISFLQSGTGAVTRTVQNKERDAVSVRDFGAVCDGTTDDTAAIQAALNTGRLVMLPDSGTCRITSALEIAIPGTGLVGGGMMSSVLTSSSTTAQMLLIDDLCNNVTLSNFKLTRSVTATSGATGIVFLGNTEETNVSNLWIEKQFIGLSCRTTGYSTINNVVALGNLSHGILFSDSASLSTLQWYVSNILSTQNVGIGLLVATGNGTTAAALGDWIGIRTFANSSYGVAVIGTATAPIHGFRLYNSFIGGDGNSEVFLDTYGSLHNISGVFTELAGTLATGPTVSTAASNIGSGFEVTPNNTDVQIIASVANGNSLAGFTLKATAKNMMVGNQSSNNKTYGLVMLDGSTAIIVGNRLNGNLIAPTFINANTTSMVASGNIPAINPGQITASVTNDNALAGNVGEYIESVIASGSAVSLVTGTGKTVTSIPLTAGDWEVEFIPSFTGGGTTTVTYLTASISLTTNTLDQTSGRYASVFYNGLPLFNNVPSAIYGFGLPSVRLSLSASTTVFGVAQAVFGTSTASAFGVLRARRVR